MRPFSWSGYHTNSGTMYAMSEKEFEARLFDLLKDRPSPPDSPFEDVLSNLRRVIEEKNGGQWGDGIARDVMTELEEELRRTQELPSSD